VTASAEPLTIAVAGGRVSALFEAPADAQAVLVLAHGAGAGMTHPFMSGIAEELARRRIATLRYQFPYMERGSKRPDPPTVATATVRAAVAEAARRLPGIPLFAGGKSFGGRMTSQAQAAAPLAGVRGLVFLGFPLHPAGRPSIERAAHLSSIGVPMLFLQGTRDTLAEVSLIEALAGRLGECTTLRLFEEADHSFRAPRRSARQGGSLLPELAQATAAWIGGAASPGCR
jgi:predicted alpha/beta-hydrolase family hydrolase